MICTLIDNQTRQFYPYILMYACTRKNFMGGKTYWEGGLGTTEQNFPIFFGAAVLIFPQAFRKLKLSQNDTYVRAQWKGSIGNFSSIFTAINQKCIILHSLSAWWIIFLRFWKPFFPFSCHTTPQNINKYIDQSRLLYINMLLVVRMP